MLSVSYDSEGILEYTVDGISVSRWVSDLPSGGLGLVSWNGGGSFNNVNYSSGTGSDTPQDDPSDTDDRITVFIYSVKFTFSGTYSLSTRLIS